MRSALASVLGLLLLSTTPAAAFDAVPRQPGKIGLGIGGGTRTTGVSLKYTATKELSFQGVAGIDSRQTSRGDDTLGLSASVLVEMPALYEEDDLEIGWCIGAGPFMGIGEDFWLGGHGVLGLELNIRVVPLEFTIEYRPAFYLASPEGGGFELVDFGGHLRWWF